MRRLDNRDFDALAVFFGFLLMAIFFLMLGHYDSKKEIRVYDERSSYGRY
jgi:hypothetical protein